MAAKTTGFKKYVVKLNREERGQLDEFIRKGKRPAQLLTKARILLKADISEAGERWSDSRIAEALDTSIPTVERTRRQLVEEGFEAVLTRKYNPKSARPRIFDGATEAKLIALTCGPAPAGYAKWSLRLLEEKVVELHIVERASDNTIGRTLKNVWPAPLQVVFSSCHDQFASTYPASGLNPGQDGDTRVPVLIKHSASSAIF